MARSSFAAEMLLGMKELGSPGTFWKKEEGEPCSLYRLRFIAACIGFGCMHPVSFRMQPVKASAMPARGDTGIESTAPFQYIA